MSARRFISFGVLIGVISLGDALMSYGAPIYLENRSGALMMGLIISSSSAGAIIFDLILGKRTGQLSSRWLLGLTILIAVLFPPDISSFPPLNTVFSFGHVNLGGLL